MTQGLPAGISNSLLSETIQLNLQNSLPPTAQAVAQQILLDLLGDRHNLTIDKDATKTMAEQAASAMETFEMRDLLLKAAKSGGPLADLALVSAAAPPHPRPHVQH